MTPIKKILEERKGLVFLPLITDYSMRISGVPASQFQEANGRSLSIYRAAELVGYDGVVNELDPEVSFASSGSLGIVEMTEDALLHNSRVFLSVETTKRLRFLSSHGRLEVCGVLNGISLLHDLHPLVEADLERAIDNLSILERLYLEAGSSCIIVLESFANRGTIEGYRVLNNIAQNYGVPSILLMMKALSNDTFLASRALGFHFVSTLPNAIVETVNPCFVIDPKKYEQIGEKILEIQSQMPVVTFATETSLEGMSVTDFSRFVSRIKKGN